MGVRDSARHRWVERARDDCKENVDGDDDDVMMWEGNVQERTEHVD